MCNRFVCKGITTCRFEMFSSPPRAIDCKVSSWTIPISAWLDESIMRLGNPPMLGMARIKTSDPQTDCMSLIINS